MYTPLSACPTSCFYPVGNTPAVNLLRHQPPEQKDFKILLNPCGDSRSILYTIWSATSSKIRKEIELDVTCCDHEPAILGKTNPTASIVH